MKFYKFDSNLKNIKSFILKIIILKIYFIYKIEKLFILNIYGR